MLEFNEQDWEWNSHSRLVILTGAGVSAESGIKTFRDAGGLWEGERIEEVASPEGFKRNPEKVIHFYNLRRQQLKTVQPNLGHEAIAKCSHTLQDRFHLITQNVDDLHQRSKTQNVFPMHGELNTLRCLKNEHVIPTTQDQQPNDLCPKCNSQLRPNIVWFGEMPFYMDKLHKIISNCTHFIYCGTSSNVYPAAGFKQLAKQTGAKTLLLNLDTPNYDYDTDFYIEGKSSILLPKILKLLF